LPHRFACGWPNWLEIRAARYVLPLLKAFKLRRYWSLTGRSFPPLSTPAGVSAYMISIAAWGVMPARAYGPLVQLTGPWLPRASPGLVPDVAAFLDASKRFVYLSIGTNAEWDCGEARLFTAAMGTLARRGLHVLWSVKRYQREACNITAAPGVMIVDFVDFVDQLAVLRHPRVALFISHCGFSSL
jgi:UDP:flavonoid glycosyltransferase YjiC (YdhE family)